MNKKQTEVIEVLAPLFHTIAEKLSELEKRVDALCAVPIDEEQDPKELAEVETEIKHLSDVLLVDLEKE